MMRKFLSQLILLFILLFCVDKIFYFMMQKLPELQYDRRLEYLIQGELSADIFIIGSSRAARDIDARLLEVLSGQPCYNLGYPGSNIEYHLFLLQQIIRQKELPDRILLVMDDSMQLIENNSINFRYDKLYPLIKYDFINQMVCKHHDKNLLLTNLFVSYRITENFPINFFHQQPSHLEMLDKNGSSLIDRKGKNWETMEYEVNDQYEPTQESTKLLNQFKSFLDICRVNTLELSLIFPPNYKNLNSVFVERITELSQDVADIYVYDKSRFEYSNKAYFYNQGHLNKKGAQVFTSELSTFLQTFEYQD